MPNKSDPFASKHGGIFCSLRTFQCSQNVCVICLLGFWELKLDLQIFENNQKMLWNFAMVVSAAASRVLGFESSFGPVHLCITTLNFGSQRAEWHATTLSCQGKKLKDLTCIFQISLSV